MCVCAKRVRERKISVSVCVCVGERESESPPISFPCRIDPNVYVCQLPRSIKVVSAKYTKGKSSDDPSSNLSLRKLALFVVTVIAAAAIVDVVVNVAIVVVTVTH